MSVAADAGQSAQTASFPARRLLAPPGPTALAWLPAPGETRGPHIHCFVCVVVSVSNASPFAAVEAGHAPPTEPHTRVCVCVREVVCAWARGTRGLQQGHPLSPLCAPQGLEPGAGPREARVPRSPRLRGVQQGEDAALSCVPHAQPFCPCHLVSLRSPKPHVQGAALLL